VGFRRQALVGVKAAGDLAALADAIAELAEASYVVTTAGSFDVIVELVCEDDEQLLHLLNDRIRTLPGVWAVETFVYLKLNKQHYDWGTR
jgi:Lrp/AsnC family transcriptional regulator for asnA, asnC and gidA